MGHFTQADINAYHARQRKIQPSSGGVNDESELHQAIIAECNRRGWIAFHGSMAHRTFRVVGEPDLQILADGGRLFLIECKTKTGKLSPEQQAIHAWANKLGHKVFVVRSFEQFLESISPRNAQEK